MSRQILHRVIFIVFFLVSAHTTHATPTPSLDPSRTSGVAPLAVFFDATDTTDTNTTSRPFHELEYTWNFGDDDNATWDYGAHVGDGTVYEKKNRATGPVSAHVFETPGTYTVTLAVYNGIETSTTTEEITVTDPDVVFAGTDTICISTSGDFTGCPSGATQVTSSDADVSFASSIGAGNKRILFRRGETFLASTVIPVVKIGPGIIGAYDVGAKPVILATSSATIFKISSTDTPTNVTDWRIMDLTLTGNNSSSNQIAVEGAGSADRFLLLRLDTGTIGGLFKLSASVLDAIGHSVIWDQMYVVDSTLFGLYPGDSNGSNALYVSSRRFGLMGTSINNNSEGEHGFRTQYCNRCFISNNTVQGVNPGKVDITIRGPSYNGSLSLPAGSMTERVVVADNKFDAGEAGGMLSTGPANQTSDQRAIDLIFERNYFLGSSSSTGAIGVNESDVTIRNNLMYLPGAGGSVIDVKDEGDFITSPNDFTPVPNRVNVYNNSVYHGGSSAGYQWVFFKITANYSANWGSTFNSWNNLFYAPNKPLNLIFAVQDLYGTNSTIYHGNNSGDTIGDAHSPSFLNLSTTFSSTTDFTLQSSSYARNTGTYVPVFSDFFGNRRPQNAPLTDMGAMEYVESDGTSPTTTEVTPIPTGTDTTPSYTFHTTELGTLTYGGSCASNSTIAYYATNTITMTTLTPGTYTDCTITVTDTALNASTPLTLTSFTITQASSGSSGSSGGGGGGKKTPLSLTRDLKQGMIGSDVKALKVFLNQNGYTLAKRGTDSKGKETTLYSTSTTLMVKKYQEKRPKDLLSTTTKQGTGIVDLRMRTYLAKLTKGSIATTTKVTTTTTPKTTVTPSKPTTTTPKTTDTTLATLAKQIITLPDYEVLGQEHSGIKTLQQFLNRAGFPVAQTGPGSQGNETTTYGPGTKAALAKLQATKGLPATGILGPRTRAVILSGWGG